MDNIKIIVDAGHGGEDPGALGNNLKEKDLTLQAAKYMNKRLNDLGLKTYMTRTEDEYLPKNKRIEKIKNELNPNERIILIANHINAGGGEGQSVTNIKYNN